MPARCLRPRCRHFFTLLALVLLVPAGVAAQTGRGSVTLTGTISKTVALSIPPNFTDNKIDVVSSGGNTVRITVSGDDTASPVIRLPLLVRSNTRFRITADFEPTNAVLRELSAIDLRPTGPWVTRLNSALEKKTHLDPDVSHGPLLVLSGPRVSFGGTLQSPNNALEATLLIRLQPQQDRAWRIHLTLVGTAE